MVTTFEAWIREPANWVFFVISIPTVVAAFLVVTSRNIVRAVLYLVVTLAGTAALFIMLGAEFVGWTVVIVYIGAVIILFLIGTMITRAPLTAVSELSQPASARLPAALLSVVLFAVIAWAVADAFGMQALPVPYDPTRTADLGIAIFTSWVIPFEAVSFVLLAVLIGGIAIARRDDPVRSDR